MKDYSVIRKCPDDYNGAGIYSLVDRNGKRYIGQSIHIQNRIDAHRTELTKVWKRQSPLSNEGSKLVEASMRGETFSVEILKKLKWNEATVNELRKWEAYFLEKYGGIDNTYNGTDVPSPNSAYDPYNEVTFIVEIPKTDKDILKRLDEVGNKQGYIKKLIRHEIDSEGKLIWLMECMKRNGIDVSYEVTQDDGISMIEVHWD